MAIFHLSAVVHSRGKGHSAVAGAAYRARGTLTDERTGERHDFGRKAADVLFEGLYAPKDAPDWTRDRAQLWNHVEAFERRRDAQLCRVFDIALPHELSLEQNRRLLQDWVRENFVRKGLIADAVIHAPGRAGDPRNIHAHVAVVMRRLDGTEFAARKERTASNEERKAALEAQRESWEKLANRHLERAGLAVRIDRRTLKEQGLDAEAGKHLGKDATALERQGIETELGNANREVAQRNAARRERAALKREVRQVAAEIVELATERLRREREAGEAREAREARAGPGAGGAAPGAQEERQGPPEALGRTAGAIRTAWSLARGGEQLEEALAAHGITLALTGADETHAGNRVLRAGEIVAVDGWGDVYRLDERTTGQAAAGIAGRLAGIDRAGLLGVTAAQEAMREASLEAWKADRRAERERARPPSFFEQRVREFGELVEVFGTLAVHDAKGHRVTALEALADRLRPDGERQMVTATVYGAEAFAVRLEDAGLAIARVTAADMPALEALREAERLDGIVNQPRHFAAVMPGDLAAVTRNGSVYRIAAAKIGDAAHYLAGDVPSVIETRARIGTEQAARDAFWAQRRADVLEWQEQEEKARQGRLAVAATERAVVRSAETIEATIDIGTKAASRAGGGLARLVGKLFDFLADMIAPAPPPTPEQAERMERVATERDEADAVQAWQDEQEAAQDWLLAEIRRQQEQHPEQDPMLGAMMNLPASGQGRGRAAGRDDERERER